MKMRSAFATTLAFGLTLMTMVTEAKAFATPLTTFRVASGLARPLFVTAPPGDTSRIFIAEQFSGTTGRVRIVNIPANTLNATPYLSITGVNNTNEEGLLGVAFHPDFYAAPGNVNRGAFFVYYTSGGNNHVVRYTATGQDPTADTADSTTAQAVIDFSHPIQSNHNGGWIAFGPDGYLYIATGDGGSACDPPGNAQNVNSLLGKMHRLDVNVDQNPGSSTVWGYLSPTGNPYIGVVNTRPEIWHYGLRNPFRDSFDRLTGELYIGDVGQNFREEISYAPAGVSNINYGWDQREGFQCSNGGASGCTSGCSTVGRTDPIWDVVWQDFYAIIGGYVYRGSLIPDLQGTYFFAEYSSARIWSFKYLGVPLTAGNVTERTAELVPTGPIGGLAINTVTSFGQDADGELYICDRGSGANGEVFKIVVNCAGASEFISIQPVSQNATAGQTVSFSVKTTGSLGLATYAWTKNSNPIGGNSATLQLQNVTCHDNGAYVCTITDQCGSSLVSDTATLSVTPLPAGDIEGDCDCDLTDIDAFVNVLLDLDTDPGHVARSDVNGDTDIDALDIQSLVDTIPNWPC